jgi:hypothetical protein
MYPVNYVPGSVAAGDFNHDGNLDVAIGAYLGSTVAVFLGKGNGTFQAEVDYLAGPGPVLIRDFDRDGNLDIVVGDSLLLNNGDGTFHLVGGARALSGAANGVSDGLETAGDFNGDGLPDLAFLEFAIHRWNVVTMLNTGALLFSPNAPVSFSAAQLVGTASAPLAVELTNTGTVPIPVRSVSGLGPFRAGGNCGEEIAAGGSCTVSVVFVPTSAGFRRGYVEIHDGASSKVQVIEASGRGTVVALSPSALHFVPQKVGTRSASRRLSITNNGAIPLTISSVDIAGVDPKDFTLSGTNACAGRGLVPGATCSVDVTFSPKKVGILKASVFVNDSGAGTPETEILTGTGK